jgi:heptaprenyl diphosphate synthase
MEQTVPTRKLAVIAILVAQASVLHFIESMFPNPLPLPGVKLGLANIITLLALVFFDFKTGLQIAVLRTILGSLLGGTLFGMGFFLSLSGAVAATLMMGLMLRLFSGFSMAGISIAGAVAHNVGQLAMAALILDFPGVFYYLPFMLLFSVPTGLLTGLLMNELAKYIQATNRLNMFG